MECGGYEEFWKYWNMDWCERQFDSFVNDNVIDILQANCLKTGMYLQCEKFSNFGAISFSKMYEQQSLKWIFTMSGVNLFFDLNWNLVEKVC